MLPKEAPEDLIKMKLGKIRKDGWCLAFQMKERTDADFHKVCFYLADRHLYTTPCLQYILEFMDKCKGNRKVFLRYDHVVYPGSQGSTQHHSETL